jgi:hypothetical protein
LSHVERSNGGVDAGREHAQFSIFLKKNHIATVAKNGLELTRPGLAANRDFGNSQQLRSLGQLAPTAFVFRLFQHVHTPWAVFSA